MSDTKKIKSVKNFIFNDEIHTILSKINNNVMNFNILEITGMGNQEIKHSNILSWLFGDNEHKLEYQILDNFLKKVIAKNSNHNIESLLKYLYLSNNKRNITIFREKDNIDLLIVDEANKIAITIENKVYANERIDGEDGGQLQKYEKNINEHYKGYDKYFIYLTINLQQSSKENWIRANYQMIVDVLEDILKTKELTTKTQIIFESYIDLLKRNGIVEDIELKNLCEKIWLKKEYADALNILLKYKTTITKKFYDDLLRSELDFLDDTVFLKLEGIEKLYKLIGLKWEDTEDSIFDVTCEYENEDIVLYYTHHKLFEQTDEKFKSICLKLKKRKSKQYEEIKRYTVDDFANKGEAYILKDIKKHINQINKKILSLIDE